MVGKSRDNLRLPLRPNKISIDSYSMTYLCEYYVNWFDLLRMRMKHRARNHDVVLIFVALAFCKSHTQELWRVPIDSTVNSLASSKPINRSVQYYIVVVKRVAMAMLWRRPVALQSSGEESSEEDEQNEASPSRRGPVSSVTAATLPPQTKKPRYIQDKPGEAGCSIYTM